MKRSLVPWIIAACLLAAACNKQEEAAATEQRDDPKHAAPDVVPGSYDDWCNEHQVPESQCTRCNPSLIPAFKATGDWCDEQMRPWVEDHLRMDDALARCRRERLAILPRQ